jgi:hypothetical protein
MTETCHPSVAVGGEGEDKTRIVGGYRGALIILDCAACFVPIELFLIEIWPRHGLISLLFIIAPLLAGWQVARLLPERYYRIKPLELSGRLYERLGIRFFKRFVPNGDYINRIIRRTEPGYRVISDKGSIIELESRTRLAETCHLAGLFLPLPSAVYALMLGWDLFALWMILPFIPFHLYPVLLQRYTRARIAKVRIRRRLGR